VLAENAGLVGSPSADKTQVVVRSDVSIVMVLTTGAVRRMNGNNERYRLR
jgi:hypothetical protein